MGAAIKLNSKAHESKKVKQDKAQTKELLQQNKTRFKPADYLDKLGLFYFDFISKYISDESISSDIDNLQINILANELATYAKATKQINEQGLTIDGKKNPLILVRNGALKNINDLCSQLGLSINSRLKQALMDVQTDNVSDPLKELINDE